MKPQRCDSPLQFVTSRRCTEVQGTAVSLFSGAGIGDIGIEAAGTRLLAQVEVASRRAALGKANFPDACWITGRVEDSLDAVRDALGETALDLLAATPPCQGMSSSNPSRGKRHESVTDEINRKNSLLLEVAPYLNTLRPKAFMAENVRQMLTLPHNESRTVLEELAHLCPDYRFWSTPINVADYGVAQDRRRALIVGLRTDLPVIADLDQFGKAPWPAPTHRQATETWISVSEWFESMNYQSLDSSSEESCQGDHPLHYVPSYGARRYRMISDIPSGSGQSAYENGICPECGTESVALELASCPHCGSELYNRPILRPKNGDWRLIKGFKSSYRRMPSNQPAPTITTNTSHIGSDFKIHPTEHRVLSPLECADLQTVPRWYDWSYLQYRNLNYLVRVVVGEAFPAYVVYRITETLMDLIRNEMPSNLADATPVKLGHRRTRAKALDSNKA